MRKWRKFIAEWRFDCDEKWLLWNKQSDETWIHTEMSFFKHVRCLAWICIPLGTLKDNTRNVTKSVWYSNDNTAYYNKLQRMFNVQYGLLYPEWRWHCICITEILSSNVLIKLSFDTIVIVLFSVCHFPHTLCDIFCIVILKRHVYRFLFHLMLLFMIFVFLPVSISIVKVPSLTS